MKTPYQAQKIEELINLGWSDQGHRLLSQRKGRDPRYLFTLTNGSGLQVFVYPDQVEYDSSAAVMPHMLPLVSEHLLSA